MNREDLHPFMVTTFVPAIRQAFAEHGFAKSMNRGERSDKLHYEETGHAAGGRFAVGIRGTIFIGPLITLLFPTYAGYLMKNPVQK